MVALDKHFRHNDTIPIPVYELLPSGQAARSICFLAGTSAESGKSVDALESLCRCGENRFLPVDRCSLPSRVGMTLDPVKGLYYSRNRNYSPSLGRVLRQEPKSRLSAGAAYREINQDPAGYPGAEAQPRPFASSGFRGIEEAYSAGERRLLPLNINGAKTYQFVESNPVGNVHPWGLAVIGFVYRITPAGDPSYVGSAVQLGGRLVPSHPYFSTMTEPTTRITVFPVDAGIMPETRAELNRSLRAMEQEVMDQTGNLGRPDLCNLRRAATPANKDQWKMDFDLNIGDPEDIPSLDPALLDNLDSILGTDGMLTGGGDELVPLLTDSSIDITALPGEAAAGGDAIDLVPFLFLGD